MGFTDFQSYIFIYFFLFQLLTIDVCHTTLGAHNAPDSNNNNKKVFHSSSIKQILYHFTLSQFMHVSDEFGVYINYETTLTTSIYPRLTCRTRPIFVFHILLIGSSSSLLPHLTLSTPSLPFPNLNF